MKLSWRKLSAFVTLLDGYVLNHKGETKIAYAQKRLQDQITKINEDLQAEITDIEIELCVVDERDVIQRDAQGNLQFTRAGLKERNQRQRALFDSLVEIEPYFIPTPEDLTEEQLEAFSGLIIREANGEDVPETANVDVQLGV